MIATLTKIQIQIKHGEIIHVIKLPFSIKT